MPIIANKISPDSVVYTDSYYSYNAGVPENAERFWGGNALGVSDFYHERVQHSKLFAKGKNHINDIENFWNQPKRVLYSVVNKF